MSTGLILNMTLLEFHSLISGSDRPQLAMKMIFTLIDLADLHERNTWVSRADVAVLTLAEGGSLASHDKNVSKVGQQLNKLDFIQVRYRDQDGQLLDSSRKGVTTLYQISPSVLMLFGRSWPAVL